MSLTQLLVTDQPFPAGEPDVQRTTFSLDVLGRFVCSTYEEATTNPDFDVVVIGSGRYGAYCAAKIHAESARAGRTMLRVLVLEAGPFLVPEHGQNIPDLGLGNPFRPVIDTFGLEAQRTRPSDPWAPDATCSDGDIVCTNSLSPPVHSTLPGSGYTFVSPWPISSSASASVVALTNPIAMSGWLGSALMAKDQMRMQSGSARPANDR